MSDFSGILLDVAHTSCMVSRIYSSSFNIDEVFCYTQPFNCNHSSKLQLSSQFAHDHM